VNEAQIIEALMQLPSARRFSEALAHDCIQGRNVLVLTGAQLAPESLRLLLDDALGRCRGPRVHAVRLEDCEADETPSAFLSRVAHTNEDAFRPSLSQSEGEDVPDTLFLLSGLECLPVKLQECWAEYFVTWTQYPAVRTHVLALSAASTPGKLHAVVGDTRLAIHSWWQGLSTLEVRLLCRLCTSATEDWAASRWREAVLPHVVGCDMRLVARLWDVVLESEDALAEALREYGQGLGLSKMRLDSLAQGLRQAAMARLDERTPRGTWGIAWSLGAAHTSQEYGTELTAAALAVLEQLPDLRNRVWRGQAALLLPHLDQLRMAVCRVLTERLGQEWPIKFGARLFDDEDREQVKADPLSTEFGPLEIILRESRFPGGKRYHPVVKRARAMRNALAHYKTVRLADYRELLDAQRAVGL
jgi:hypothetical protein